MKSKKSQFAYNFMLLSLLVATATISGMMSFIFGRTGQYNWLGVVLFTLFTAHIFLHWLDVLRVGGLKMGVVKPE